MQNDPWNRLYRTVSSPGRSSIIRTKESIRKLKDLFESNEKMSSQKLAVELNISRTSVRRILKNDLILRLYKKIIEPLLINEHKEKRKSFRIGYKDVFEKEGPDEDSVPDEKLFDRDGINDFQNDCIWAVNRVEAEKTDDRKQNENFLRKWWFGWLCIPRECHQSSFLMKERSIMPDTSEKCFRWLSNPETTSWTSIGHFNKMAQCLVSII